jgi:AcrR family transcriptional regulator
MPPAKRSTKRRPGRPPGSTSDATRARILSAARTCFGSQGFVVTTNRDIADRAGVTPAAIYQYFDSKLALYATAAREAVIDIAGHMRAHIATDGSAARALRGVLLSLLAMHERDPSLTPFFAAMRFEAQRSPEIAQAIAADRNEILAVMAKVVEFGVGSGEIDAAAMPRVITMFIACVMGLSQFSTGFGREYFAEAVTAYAELLDGSLFRRPPPTAKPRATRKPPSRRAATKKSAPSR